jgi:RNA polymerase sigma-70 factor (ECF subfamily)
MTAERPPEMEMSVGGGSEDDLVAGCKRGDERAFEELYRRFAPAIYRHLQVLLGGRGEPEDALQQVFEQAFRSIHRFAGRSSFSTWLHGIALRVALNVRRSWGRRDNAMSAFAKEEPGSPPPLDQAVSARQELERLEAHLSGLSEKRRVAFLLYYVEQLELGELARRLGVSPATAWARVVRARDEILARVAGEPHAAGKTP